MFLFDHFNSRRTRRNPIIIASGLPRSGTSMLMQILKVGGIEPVTDNQRKADCDNLNGYYEHEAVKALAKGDYDCLKDAQGRAIKVVSPLLKYLPDDYHYKVVFMHRDIDEILASQNKMLDNLDRSDNANNDHALKTHYTNHLSNISKWLTYQDNMSILDLHYAQLLDNPEQHAISIMEFLNLKRNKKQMIAVIDKNLRHHTNEIALSDK